MTLRSGWVWVGHQSYHCVYTQRTHTGILPISLCLVCYDVIRLRWGYSLWYHHTWDFSYSYSKKKNTHTVNLEVSVEINYCKYLPQPIGCRRSEGPSKSLINANPQQHSTTVYYWNGFKMSPDCLHWAAVSDQMRGGRGEGREREHSPVSPLLIWQDIQEHWIIRCSG